MRRLMPVLLAVVLSVTSLHAEAKRMGGGKSFGRQSSNVTQQQSTPTAPGQPGAGMQQTQTGRTANQTAPAQTAPQRKPWAGILGGLAAGLGLAWLANALGFGEGFANMLMILLACCRTVACCTPKMHIADGTHQAGAVIHAWECTTHLQGAWQPLDLHLWCHAEGWL